MQSWLPYPSYAESARVLDPKRLGKQRVEALQIIRALHIEGYGWRHHPAVRMWRGHERALLAYGIVVCDEWIGRGFKDTVRAQLHALDDWFAALGFGMTTPPWLGWEPLHLSHRSSLLRKDPAWYRPIFGDEPDDLPYVWPDPATFTAGPKG